MSIPLFLRQKKTGVVYLNELKRHVKPYFLVPQDLGNVQGQLAVVANNTNNAILIPDQQGPFEGMYWTAEHGGHMLVRINDSGFRRDMMNRDVHVDTIMTPVPGAQDPFMLPETLWLAQRHALTLTFTDISGANQTIRPVLHGRKFFLKQAKPGLANRFLARREQQQRISTPYFYTTDANVTLAAAAVGTRAQMTISEEGHFVAHKITCVSDGPFDMIIKDSRDGQALSGSIVVSNTQCTGIAARPYIFPEPWFIERNTQLLFEFNNRFALGANRIWMTFSGRRVYDESYQEII